MRITWSSACRLLLAAGLAVPGVVARAEIFEAVIVKVNGDIFTKTDLETRQVAALRQRGLLPEKNDPNDEQLKKALGTVTPQIVVDAVSELLVVQRGKELGYKLSDEQFKSIVENIRKENKLDTEEKFQAALKQDNMTMADFRRQIERNVIASRVQQTEVFSKVSVSDAEAKKYYDEHLDEFASPAEVTLREVLVPFSTEGKVFSVGQDNAARVKAEDLRSRAVAGEGVEKLATEFSGAPSRSNGGLIGPISLNDLSPDLRTLVEPMKQGDITPVIRTTRGYQFFRLESMNSSQRPTFGQARDQISERVGTDKRKGEMDKYLNKLRAQAIIEWKNADLKKAYEEGLAEDAKAAAAPAK
jgi:parvulin-like peptidyl-prolyl isomerase